MMNSADREFRALVSEMRPFNFSTASEISRYIMKNRIAFKYRHIAGNLNMRNGSDTWTFKGGISPRYYRALCEELGLDGPRSNARVEGFTAFAEA